jgi:hypothetical protein
VTPKDVLSLEEASRYLAMDQSALSVMAAERRIPCLELNGDWVFSKKSIDKWRSQQAIRKS